MAIEVIVSGAAGRLGRRVLAAVARTEGLSLVGAVVRPGSAAAGRSLAELSGEPRALGQAVTELGPLLSPRRVLIETAPKAIALTNVRAAADKGAAVLVATTGFSNVEREAIEGTGQRVPVLLAANLSLGIGVLTELVRPAARALPGYDLEVLELHHNQKKDAPSGTAWLLARAAAEARGQKIDDDAIVARAGDVGARGKREIGLQSIRGGDIIGEHTVFVVGGAERIELTHRAQTRDVFAEGAAQAALFLGAGDRAPGVYGMRHVLGLGGS